MQTFLKKKMKKFSSDFFSHSLLFNSHFLCCLHIYPSSVSLWDDTTLVWVSLLYCREFQSLSLASSRRLSTRMRWGWQNLATWVLFHSVSEPRRQVKAMLSPPAACYSPILLRRPGNHNQGQEACILPSPHCCSWLVMILEVDPG